MLGAGWEFRPFPRGVTMKKQLRSVLAAAFAVLAVVLAAPAVSASATVAAQPDCVRPCHF
ncbi:hypothetical protein CFP75_26200 [Amycolatopsis alba DSM 44262]|uniref:Uncharacterized protein n=1 Tax=Amycolatopsis alba DSM 44262 TaxID=1125972 RepID=A0A229RJF2_AMYAL|nr:hypothetical protein CFP75_26200 [Amycolatopsis alba DSM 44262]